MLKFLLLSTLIATLSACTYRETSSHSEWKLGGDDTPAPKETPFVPGSVAVVPMQFEAGEHHHILSLGMNQTAVQIDFLGKTDLKQTDLNLGQDIAIDFADPYVAFDNDALLEHTLATVEIATLRWPGTDKKYSAGFNPVSISAYKLEKRAINVTRIYLSRAWLQKTLAMAKPLDQANVFIKINYHMKLKDFQSIWPNRNMVERSAVCCSTVPGMVRAGAVLIPVSTPAGKSVDALLQDSSDIEDVLDPARI